MSTSSPSTTKPRIARRWKALIALLFGVFAVTLTASPALAWDTSTHGVSVSSVQVNDRDADATIKLRKGAAFNLSFNYTIVDTGCPGCIDQIEVGYAQSPTKDGCVYSGVPGSRGASGSASYNMVAPITAGVYYLAIGRGQDYSCKRSTANWWDGTPNPQTQYIARLQVS